MKFIISVLLLFSFAFAKNFQEWQKEADKGDIEAAKTVASMYERGFGVQKDETKAFEYYLKAAMHLDQFSCMQIAMMYKNGTGVKKSEKEAKKWINCSPAKELAFEKQKGEIKIEPVINLQQSFSSLVDHYSDRETKSNVKQILSRHFGLYPYKSNYFLPFSYDTNLKSDRKRYEAKFQISFMKPLVYNLFGLNETFFFGYTQQSYWQIYSNSSPFRETNYEPEIFVLFPIKNREFFLMDALRISIDHQSNGQKGLLSRSWNRIYAEGLFHYRGFVYTIKGWYRIPENEKKSIYDGSGDDNPDILSYLGYGEIKVAYPFGKHLVSMLLRNNLRKKNRGSIQLDWSFPIKCFKNSFGYIQFFNGYGESLIDYNKNSNKISIGFMYSR